MTYRQLNEATVVEYLREIPSFKPLVMQQTQAKEVGDGNLNFVYIVGPLSEGRSLVVKQAVPYLRCAGEDYHLDKDRMRYESRSLKQFSEWVKAHVPVIHHVDDEMALVVMQCLDHHIIMRKGLIAKTQYPLFSEHISTFLAEVLFRSSSFCLSGKDKRALMADYVKNDELCKITEDFVFSTAYMPHETNPDNPLLEPVMQKVYQDEAFKLQALILKNKFMSQTDALLHGDLHTGSVMVNQEETYVIDSEFAFFGPFGFDLGAMLANLLLAWVSHFERSKDQAYQQWLLDTSLGFYRLFEEKFLSLWNQQSESGLLLEGFANDHLLKQFQQHTMHRMLQDTIGFAGMKMARRILGIAGVADIREIEEPQARYRAEVLALNIARSLVMQRHQVQSIEDILPILSKEQQRYERASHQAFDYSIS